MTPVRATAAALRLALLAYLVAALASCSSCERDSYVAELIATQEHVERDFARAQNTWSDADTGARLALGDGLRTGQGAQATLSLARQGRLLVKSDTVVRFVASPDPQAPQQQLEVQQGELTIESGAQPLGVRTARGLVTLRPASVVRVRAGSDTTRFDVEVGHVEYARNGAVQVAQAGASFELEVLSVSVERGQKPGRADASATIGSEAADAAETAEIADLGSTQPTPEGFQASPASALLRFAAGESPTIHDPAPPTDIAVTAGACAQGSVLEVVPIPKRGPALRFRGAAEVLARLARGSYRYRVRCVQEGPRDGALVGDGQLRIVADAATRPLPLSAAKITADADGRRYTVSYQNRLPITTLRWPYAPHADNYLLFVQPEHGEPLRIESSQPSVTLGSGRLREGLYRFWFETPDHKRSETGTLQVSFDYTARTAYLTSPREREAPDAARARFAGGTLLGSRVELEGATLKLDAHGRFAATIEVPDELAGAAVRVQHASTGLHYYVRHFTR